MENTIPVLLLTGYLGSGKTTLLNRILNNRRGIRFAVIVNDIGEVNIDADLIRQGGIVGGGDDSLVALQNGCICCTLKMDLVEQLCDLASQRAFDYIVVEASGVCEPEPIARTIVSIPYLGPEYSEGCIPKLDCVVSVVDVLRLRDEFACAKDLIRGRLAEDDIENLIIQQVEFCNVVLLNKAAEISADELGRIRAIIRELQPKAEIIECNFGDVELDRILGTGLFDYDSVAGSATWITEVEKGADIDDDDDDDDDHDEHEHDEHEHGHHHEHEHEHEHKHEHHHEHGHEDGHQEGHEEGHHHHHHHHDGEGEADEYGIGTYVYFARKPFDINRFDRFISKQWPAGVIRSKGLCYFSDETDKCYLFEQAGSQMGLKLTGNWYATMPEDELEQQLSSDATLRRDWDPVYGDRMQKLVFIGQHLDKAAIKQALDFCLVED